MHLVVQDTRTISIICPLHSRTSKIHSRGRVCTQYVTYLVGRNTPEADAGSFHFQATDDVTNTRDFQNVH